MGINTIGKNRFVIIIFFVLLNCILLTGCNVPHVNEEDYTGRKYYKVLPDNNLSTDSYIEFKTKDHLKLYNFEFDQNFIEWFYEASIELEDAVNVDLEYFIHENGKLFIHIYDSYAIYLEIDSTGNLIYNNIVFKQNS